MKRKPNQIDISSGLDLRGEFLLKSRSVPTQKTDPAVLKLFLLDNYLEYIKKPLRIGFTHAFPEDTKSVIDTIKVFSECRGFPVTTVVRYGKVTFGKKNEFSCHGITTTRTSISEKLQLNGWAQYAHVDESGTMEFAVKEMAQKHGLMICEKICSWPFAKAIVQKPEEAHLRCYKQKN